MGKRYVYPLTSRNVHPHAGSKATNLQFLMRNKIPVPPAWVVVWTALEDSRQNAGLLQDDIRRELKVIIRPDKLYAVRSSASVEDIGECSCAGLFKSFLQVKGLDEILDRVDEVWQSLDSPEFLSYRQNNISSRITAHMAVIIQEMVPALSSGVAFSKNPITGLSETIIEAGSGTGEQQSQSHRTPECWVSKWGNWLKKPEQSIINEELARSIVYKTAKIARLYRRPIDLEWAWDGQCLFFLQVRPITRLDIPIYSNRIAREMLPGIIKPLVWSVNTRLINQTWVEILARLTGDDSYNPEKLTGHFYYRAYFNMAIFGRVFERLGMPAEALELLFGLEQDGPDKPHMRPNMGIMVRLPRLIGVVFSFAGISRRLTQLTKDREVVYRELATRMTGNISPEDCLLLATRILEATKDVAYFNIVIPMLAMMHNRFLASMIKKHGYDIRSLELLGAKEAAAKYNPQDNLQLIHDRYYGGHGHYAEGEDPLTPEQKQQLEIDIEQFMSRFGHFSESGNDCSSIPWRETPELIHRMIARSNREKPTGSALISFPDMKLPWHRRWWIWKTYQHASRFAVEREVISSLYTYGYGQFRTCFVRLGEMLVQQGIFEDREDIYYLYWHELISLVTDKAAITQKDLVSRRKQDIESFRDAILPETIFGSEQPPLVTDTPAAMRGIPTSLGTYTGPARVIRGIADFERLLEGDVLIIPFSDVGWTPLFAKAKAVIAESGGILSHSSIIAREYGIPAVVSASNACRMAEGILVTVNGYTGDIFVAEADTAGQL